MSQSLKIKKSGFAWAVHWLHDVFAMRLNYNARSTPEMGRAHGHFPMFAPFRGFRKKDF